MKRLIAIIFLLAADILLLAPPLLAQWGPDRRLTFNDGSSITSLNNAWCIGTNGDFIHVVWQDSRTSYLNLEIYYKRSTNGGRRWGSDLRLTNSSSSEFPAISVSGANVHVVWSDRRNGYFNTEIYYKRSTDAGLSWGSDTRLTYALDDSYYSSIAVAGSNVHVVWEDYRSRPSQIYYKRSINGGASWEADYPLTNPSSPRYPSIAVSGNNVHVVWQDYRDGNSEIYYKRSTDGGTRWEADTRLTNNSAWSDCPSIAVSLHGGVYIVWPDGRDGNPDLYFKRSTNGGLSWETDVRLTDDDSSSYNPSVAVSEGNIHIVWWDLRNGSGSEIYYKYSTNGGASWEPDTRLTNDQSFSYRPSVAVSGNNVHVVWFDERDGNDEIYYKRKPTGNSGTETAEERGQRLEVRITAKPNPFTSFASVPGQEKETFDLYDIAGRKVGSYKGDRIGEGLAAGVYFLKPEGKDVKPIRVVKLR